MTGKKLFFQKSGLFAVLICAISLGLFLTCADPDLLSEGETRLSVSMNGQALSRLAGRAVEGTVESLKITVVRIDIIRSSDGAKITLLDEPRNMDVLAIAANDPVVFSDVSVEPGQYEQLRLVLDDSSTIVINGVEHPIKIPSGQQTGIKLSGTFTVPPGKLFEINLAFDVNKSVHYAPGQGYMFKPVIEVIGSGNVIGIFRGILSLIGFAGEAETVIELNDRNGFRLKISDYPDYTITGNYYYNAFLKIVKLNDFSVDASGLSRTVQRRVQRELPDVLYLPIKEWSLDSVIVLDIAGAQRALHRTERFQFSDTYTYTDLTITVTYPDTSKDGKDVVVRLGPLSGQRRVNPIFTVFEGNTAVARCSFNDTTTFISGNSLEYEGIAILFDDIDKDLRFEFRVIDGRPVLLMWPAWYLEKSHTIGQPEDNIIVITKGLLNTHALNFP